ncbi:MAG: glycogen debranching enzyme, partial [Novosphingobium sp.]
MRSPEAQALTVCLTIAGAEQRIVMHRDAETWVAEVPGNLAGAHYGYRAEGEWNPERGLWFDPAKLLVDPYALELDQRYHWHPDLARHGAETGPLVPKAIVPHPLPKVAREPLRFIRGGLIYELNVRGFTMLHPGVPEALRGTVAALAHPAMIAHFRKFHVSAIELMPI